jgi:4-hydroxy-tetrahydrodipicolinate reductase
MLDCIVVGATGRMGGRLCAMIGEADDMRLVGAVSRPAHAAIGADIGEVIGIGRLGVPLSADLGAIIRQAGVVIEFVAKPTLEHVSVTAEARIPMVIGSTGHSPEQVAEIRELAQSFPCVLAPNMSVGVNLLFKLAGEVANVLDDGFDVEIVEAHHRGKKDAPSGTALRLAEAVVDARGQALSAVLRHGREGLVSERPIGEIGIHAIRGGDLAGDHVVSFMGPGEVVELRNRCTSRDTFVEGALRAARYAVNAPPGLYDMQDVLGLRREPGG